MTTPNEVIEYLRKPLLVAGRYAAQIQNRVGVQAQKEGATAFHHALSDADLTVQSYLEVHLLARFPHLSFFSEEQAQSLNCKYFPKNQQLEVLLDPIDGTRAYIDGKEGFQIIVTVHNEEEIVGAILHMPRRGVTYSAVKGEGAWKYLDAQIESNGRGEKIDIAGRQDSSLPILCFDAADLTPHFSPEMNVKDLLIEYDRDPAKFSSTDLIEGKARGIFHRPCQAIDGGALAFIAVEAGGIATDFDGNPIQSYRKAEKRTVTNVVVAANREAHSQIINALKSR